jgi:UDP-N-acetylmuramyl pentapeptide phosphotransferase/UDP-N-acetylglucosamine-1-phosphate transferase
VIAAILACIGARILVSGSQRRRQTLDETLGGLRKVHAIPTPRIGGIAVAIGVLAGAAIGAMTDGHAGTWLLLLACVSPAFIWGLIEDLSKRGAVLPRLVLPAVAAALGFILLDARLTELDIPVVDDILVVHACAFLFTVFAVTGVTHAVNVIDGLNGLAGVTTLLAAIGLAIVAAMVGDAFILSASLVLAASVAGFLLVNYPSGRIFLGDGGAYLVGLLLAELSVMLVHRNSEVSPWFPPVLLAFPIWETIFSMYRRRTRGHSTARADALHLHQLVYRRIVRWRGFSADPRDRMARNSVASLYLWVVPAACLLLALAFWDDSLALQVIGVSYWVVYGLVYRAVVRFKVPRWLVLKVPDPVPALGEDQLTNISSKLPR